MMAKAIDRIPAPRELRGGARYEPKWDGFRVIARVDEHGGVQLSSRRGTRLNEAFPEIVMAVFDQLPARTVVDGEIVRWSEDNRLDFTAAT